MGTQLFNKRRLVAFIDVLGFEDLIGKSENLEKIYNAVKNFHELAKEGIVFAGLDEYYSGIDNRDRNISIFSDSIVISYAFHENNDYYSFLNLYELISGLLRVQTLLIREKIFIRGGIAIGELFHNNEICIGKGLIEAYTIESKIATYPIILIHPDIVNSEKFKAFEYKEVIEKKIISSLDNGFYYIDYFKELYEPFSPILANQPSHFRSVDHSYITSLKASIEQGVSSSKLDVRVKYSWLKGKYKALISQIEQSCIIVNDELRDHKL